MQIMDPTYPPQEPFPDGAEQAPILELEQLENFRIVNPREIASVLKHLMFSKNFIGVWHADRSYHFVTRILGVDPTAGVFFHDVGADPTHSQFFRESDENHFSVVQAGIRIQFVCRKPSACEFEGVPAYRSAFPASLYRIQRREAFRVRAPVTQPFLCNVRVPDGRQMRFDIFDLSLNGTGLYSKDPSLAKLPIGTVLKRAVLDFRDWGRLETDLEITYLHNIRNSNDPLFHFGCRFIDLSQAREADLQRLITRLELMPKNR
jgi:c-di-GMP-binding flagellar brake protein YcgR